MVAFSPTVGAALNSAGVGLLGSILGAALGLLIIVLVAALAAGFSYEAHPVTMVTPPPRSHVPPAQHACPCARCSARGTVVACMKRSMPAIPCCTVSHCNMRAVLLGHVPHGAGGLRPGAEQGALPEARLRTQHCAAHLPHCGDTRQVLSLT